MELISEPHAEFNKASPRNASFTRLSGLPSTPLGVVTKETRSATLPENVTS